MPISHWKNNSHSFLNPQAAAVMPEVLNISQGLVGIRPNQALAHCMYRTEAARAQGWESQVTGRACRSLATEGRPAMHLKVKGRGQDFSLSQIQQQEGPDVDPRHLPCLQHSSTMKVLCRGLSKGPPPQELPTIISPLPCFSLMAAVP